MALNINGTTGISGVDGSASAPAVTGTDSNTGINFGSDTVNINTGGSTRATIDSSGRLLLGTTTEGVDTGNDLTIANSGDCGITIRSGTSSKAKLLFSDGTSGDDEFRGNIQYDHNGDYMKISTNASERMRIDSSGRVLINTTSNFVGDSHFEVHSTDSNGSGFYNNNTSNNYPVIVRNNRCDGGTTGTLIHFTKSGGSEIGSIRANGSSTSYNTSSDYRLKENVTAISDGITRLKTLKPSRFNFKVDTDTTVDGFLAHEVTAVPEAITGTKDEVATEDETNFTKGDPIYQSIDQSKLVPLLTAALQEAIAKIETLEIKVAALEAG